MQPPFSHKPFQVNVTITTCKSGNADIEKLSKLSKITQSRSDRSNQDLSQVFVAPKSMLI